MNQDSIHTVLKTEMLKTGYLNEKSASADGWTSDHQAAWNSYAYHRLGLANHTMVPNNKEALTAIGIHSEAVASQEPISQDVEDQEFEEEESETTEAPKSPVASELSFVVNLNADSD